MHVSTQNVFSLIFHIVLHQVHWHLFCHLLYYLYAKNHKFGTCRLSARDYNLGVLLSGPPCMYVCLSVCLSDIQAWRHLCIFLSHETCLYVCLCALARTLRTQRTALARVAPPPSSASASWWPTHCSASSLRRCSSFRWVVLRELTVFQMAWQ